MLDYLIRNAQIITMDDSSPVVYGSIGISCGKIAFIGSEPAGVSSKETIDAAGNIVMPGLINTHGHAAMTVLRGYADDYALKPWLFDKIFPAEAKLDRNAIIAGTRIAIAEMLASGTTSFSDMYFYEPDAARLVSETGIRASLSNGITAFSNDFCFEKDRAVTETMELIRDWHGFDGGRIRADAAIHGEYTSKPCVWEKIAELAYEHDLVTQIHISETKSEHAECIFRYGLTPVQVLEKYGVFRNRVIAAHGVWLCSKDIDILAEHHASVAHNPVSNLKLASGIADIDEMISRGVNVSLGTDGCASNNNLDLFEEVKLSALLAKHIHNDPTKINAYRALKLATVNGAKAQGRENEIGMLKAGMEADLIMLDVHKAKLQPIYDPTSTVVYSASGSDVCLTMVKGKILYRYGEYSTIDIEKAIYELNRTAEALRQ